MCNVFLSEFAVFALESLSGDKYYRVFFLPLYNPELYRLRIIVPSFYPKVLEVQDVSF